MSKLFIDDKAIEFIKGILETEKSDAVRIFISGGGCCKRFEIKPVKKALAGDVTYRHGRIIVHVDKELATGAGSIDIRYEKEKGLVINFE